MIVYGLAFLLIAYVLVPLGLLALSLYAQGTLAKRILVWTPVAFWVVLLLTAGLTLHCPAWKAATSGCTYIPSAVAELEAQIALKTFIVAIPAPLTLAALSKLAHRYRR